MAVFSVNGFWNDDKAEFSGYLVAEYDNTPEGYTDEQIFFYGLSEPKLIGNHGDFTITSYEVANG